MLDLGFRDHLLQRTGEVLDDDDGLGAGILQLVLEFARRVQRIDVDHCHAGAQDADQRHRVLQQIGTHDRRRVRPSSCPAGSAEKRRSRASPVEFGIAHAAAEIVISRLVVELDASFSIRSGIDANRLASISAGTPAGYLFNQILSTMSLSVRYRPCRNLCGTGMSRGPDGCVTGRRCWRDHVRSACPPDSCSLEDPARSSLTKAKRPLFSPGASCATAPRAATI